MAKDNPVKTIILEIQLGIHSSLKMVIYPGNKIIHPAGLKKTQYAGPTGNGKPATCNLQPTGPPGAEILFVLLNKSRIHIRALAQNIGYAYSCVYRDVMRLTANGFLKVEEIGKIKLLHLSEPMLKYIKAIPV